MLFLKKFVFKVMNLFKLVKTKEKIKVNYYQTNKTNVNNCMLA